MKEDLKNENNHKADIFPPVDMIEYDRYIYVKEMNDYLNELKKSKHCERGVL